MRRGRLAGLVRGLRPAKLIRVAAGAAALLLLAGGAGGGARQLQPEGLTVRLQKGWNNVPYYGPATEPQVALSAISGRYSSVYYWDAVQQRYLAHDAANPTAGELSQLQPGRAYWIVATSAAQIDLPPPLPGMVPALATGWNNLVYTGLPAPVEEALAPLAGHFSTVYGWDAALQRFRRFDAREGGGDLAMLTPYGCYWLDFT